MASELTNTQGSTPRTYKELAALLALLGYSKTKPDLERLGRELGRIAGRSPYAYTTVWSYLDQNPPPSERFERAVQAKLAEFVGGHPIAEASIPGVVRLFDLALQGALVHGEVRYCRRCLGKFVPNHPRRLDCFVCSPSRSKV